MFRSWTEWKLCYVVTKIYDISKKLRHRQLLSNVVTCNNRIPHLWWRTIYYFCMDNLCHVTLVDLDGNLYFSWYLKNYCTLLKCKCWILNIILGAFICEYSRIKYLNLNLFKLKNKCLKAVDGMLRDHTRV